MDHNVHSRLTMIEKCLCKLNLHDFEIIKRENEGTLIKHLERDLYQNHHHKSIMTTNVLETKVCVRCGKIIDEIKDFTKDYIEDKIQTYQRQRKANGIYRS